MPRARCTNATRRTQPMVPAFLRGRVVALALSISAILPASAALAATNRDSTAAREIELTERDVAASNEKLRAAYSDLAGMWSNGFAQLGDRFATPRLLRYRGAVR